MAPSTPRNNAHGTTSVPLLGTSRSGRPTPQGLARDRRAELAAAFGGSDDEDDEDDSMQPSGSGFGRSIDTSLTQHLSPSIASSSPPRYDATPSYSPPVRASDQDVFFDAGDALPSQDPLGANRVNLGTARTPTATVQIHPPPPSSGPVDGAYDFEDTSYFTPQRPHPSRQSSMVALAMSTPDGGDHEPHGEMHGMAGDHELSNVARLRYALGRFGRFVGMRVPGATYSTVHGDDGMGSAQRRRVIGSGIGQDGVFANLNAKPERRRRRGDNGEDRGEDDDLADDVLPPAYEVAAADAAPPYWETTIIGGPGGFHPLAPGGAGWTPGGPHVGALEDLIIEGLPLGNFFGFAWNLLVSMSFQFIGFLLTYLLHTTHAARCGSRAGLGITLVQYGFYLRTRAAQMLDEGGLIDPSQGPAADPPLPSDAAANSMVGGGQSLAAWLVDGSQVHSVGAGRDLVSRGLHFIMRQAATQSAPLTNHNATLAQILANDDGSLSSPVNVPSPESISASTEWLAYVLMGLGWFILLTSLLSFFRVHRFGRKLVDAAHRENQSNTAEGASGEENGEGDAASPVDPEAPVGFLHTFRHAVRQSRRARAQRGARSAAPSGEDWIVFPGRPRRDLLDVPPPRPTTQVAQDLEAGDPSAESRRLVEDMRSVGLIR